MIHTVAPLYERYPHLEQPKKSGTERPKGEATIENAMAGPPLSFQREGRSPTADWTVILATDL